MDSSGLNKKQPKMDSTNTRPNIAKNFKESMGQLAQAGFAPRAIASERMNICLDCKFFHKIRRSCLKCGCFMDAKTKIARAYCPMHYWEAFTQEDMKKTMRRPGTSLSKKSRAKLED